MIRRYLAAQQKPRVHLDRSLAQGPSQKARLQAQQPRLLPYPRRPHLSPSSARLHTELTASDNHVQSTGFLTCRYNRGKLKTCPTTDARITEAAQGFPW